jgi:hypothetical protein
VDISKENLYQVIDDIRKLISDSEKEDGSLGIDVIKAKVVLEFAKSEIEKTISK